MVSFLDMKEVLCLGINTSQLWQHSLGIRLWLCLVGAINPLYSYLIY